MMEHMAFRPNTGMSRLWTAQYLRISTTLHACACTNEWHLDEA